MPSTETLPSTQISGAYHRSAGMWDCSRPYSIQSFRDSGTSIPQPFPESPASHQLTHRKEGGARPGCSLGTLLFVYPHCIALAYLQGSLGNILFLCAQAEKVVGFGEHHDIFFLPGAHSDVLIPFLYSLHHFSVSLREVLETYSFYLSGFSWRKEWKWRFCFLGSKFPECQGKWADYFLILSWVFQQRVFSKIKRVF